MLKRILLCLIVMAILPPAAFASTWGDYHVNGWYDDVSDFEYFSLSPDFDKVGDRMIIIHDTKTGQWHRLEASYEHLWKSQEHNFPGIYLVEEGERDFFKQYYYDVASNTVFEGGQYELSPSGRFGVRDNSYYEEQQPIIRSYLIKNFDTGKIVEWIKANSYAHHRWLPDNTILYCLYSEQEKQNVIRIYNPERGSHEKVLSGTMYSYKPDTSEILFVRNEPLRKRWIKNLTTGEVKPASASSSGDFYPDMVDRSPLLPEDLDINDLNVVTPRRAVQNEHVFITEDQRIPLTFVFSREGREFIPIRPLLEPLNIQVQIQELGPYKKDYYISFNDKRVKLQQGDYVNYQWRLFVTGDVLKQMGLQDFSVMPMDTLGENHV